MTIENMMTRDNDKLVHVLLLQYNPENNLKLRSAALRWSTMLSDSVVYGTL